MGKIEFKHQSDYCTTEWSGGKTTELSIYPENERYADRNFGIRVSSATITSKRSTFSDVTGYERILMPLTHAITLIQDQSRETVQPLQQIQFSGGVPTKSIGMSTDFNLMCSENFNGKLDVITENTTIRTSGAIFEGFYLFSGNAELNKGENTYNLCELDSVFLLEEPADNLNIKAKSPFILIHVVVAEGDEK